MRNIVLVDVRFDATTIGNIAYVIDNGIDAELRLAAETALNQWRRLCLVADPLACNGCRINHLSQKQHSESGRCIINHFLGGSPVYLTSSEDERDESQSSDYQPGQRDESQSPNYEPAERDESQSPDYEPARALSPTKKRRRDDVHVALCADGERRVSVRESGDAGDASSPPTRKRSRGTRQLSRVRGKRDLRVVNSDDSDDE